MKKAVMIFLTSMLLLSLFGCGKIEINRNTSDDKIIELSSTKNKEDLITIVYNETEILDYFFNKCKPLPIRSISITDNKDNFTTIDDVKSKYPFQYMKKHFPNVYYVIYKTDKDKLLYVFFEKPYLYDEYIFCNAVYVSKMIDGSELRNFFEKKDNESIMNLDPVIKSLIQIVKKKDDFFTININILTTDGIYTVVYDVKSEQFIELIHTDTERSKEIGYTGYFGLKDYSSYIAEKDLPD